MRKQTTSAGSRPNKRNLHSHQIDTAAGVREEDRAVPEESPADSTAGRRRRSSSLGQVVALPLILLAGGMMLALSQGPKDAPVSDARHAEVISVADSRAPVQATRVGTPGENSSGSWREDEAPGSAHSQVRGDGRPPKSPNPWFYLERAYPRGIIPREEWQRAQLRGRTQKRCARTEHNPGGTETP